MLALARPRTAVIRAAGALLLVFGAGGCARACKNDHPYVPPAVELPVTAADAAASATVVSELTPDAGAGVEPALAAPPSAESFKVGELTLAVPGREIVLALVRDFDGDDNTDALVVARAPAAERKADTATGELVYFRGVAGGAIAPPTTIAEGPRFGVQPSCAPIARLERIGPRSAFAEIGTACTRGAASRGLFVVRLGAKAPAVAFDATVADPMAAPKLTVDVDAADRDRDGNDDVVLRVAIEGGGPPFEAGPKLGAKLAFFDRPAGPSRDPDEPGASLRAIAAQAASKATRVKDAPSVSPLVQQMRALYRAMCLEGGAPRIANVHGGGAVPCGASKPLEDAGVAEVRAFVTQGDALRAFAAAELAQAAPATRTAARTAELDKLLAQVAPVVTPRSARIVSVAVDAPRGAHPEWGPLAFEAGGKLLVRSQGRVARVDPDTGESEEAEIGAWPAQVVSPDGKSRWIEAYHACEGVALRATFAPTGDGDMIDVLLPVAPRLGKSCSGGRGEPAPAIPIAWSARGLEAIVAGQPVLVTLDAQRATTLTSFVEEPPPLGSPRAPGGRAIAIPASSGVLVRADHWQLARAPELEPYAELRHCTVSDGAGRLACVKRGRLVTASF